MAATGPAQAVAMAPTLAVGQGVVGAHLAVKTRSENASQTALNAVAGELGNNFASRIAQLPYNKDGLAEARRMLYQVDSRFHAFATDPYFSTKALAQKEVKKGGNADEINKLEWSRATGRF